MDPNSGDERNTYREYGQFGRRIAHRYARRGWRGYRQGLPTQSGLGVGLFLIAFGIVLFLDNIGVMHIRDIWEYWPLLICMGGLQHLIRSRTYSGRVWGVLMVAAGTVLLVNNLGMLHISGGALWALFIIGIGVMLLIHNFEEQQRIANNPSPGVDPNPMPEPDFAMGGFPPPPENVPFSNENYLKEWVVFYGSNRRIETDNFQGGELIAVFGGIDIDLRRAKISAKRKEVVIDTVAVFGGISVKVPETWRVVVRGVGVFGGYEDKTIPPRTEAGVEPPTLVVTGSAVFGGVSVE